MILRHFWGLIQELLGSVVLVTPWGGRPRFTPLRATDAMALPPLERIPAHLESQPVAPTRQNHRAAAPMFELFPCQRFRDTPSVGFFDITVSASNARDLVVHRLPILQPIIQTAYFLQ